jgi:hypothetical protein
MAEEGQVISCHTVEAWKEHLQKENESKKLVCLITQYSLFLFFWCVIFFSYSTFFFSSKFWILGFQGVGSVIIT